MASLTAVRSCGHSLIEVVADDERVVVAERPARHGDRRPRQVAVAGLRRLELERDFVALALRSIATMRTRAAGAHRDGGVEKAVLVRLDVLVVDREGREAAARLDPADDLLALDLAPDATSRLPRVATTLGSISWMLGFDPAAAPTSTTSPMRHRLAAAEQLVDLGAGLPQLLLLGPVAPPDFFSALISCSSCVDALLRLLQALAQRAHVLVAADVVGQALRLGGRARARRRCRA